MNRRIHVLAIAAIVAAVGCSDRRNRATDTTLNTDLSLAAQQSAYRQFDSVSAAERGLATPTPVASARRTTSTSGGEVTTVRRRTTRSSGSSSSTARTPTSTQGTTTVEKHTNRDAAIGAAAGAVIGATTSRNKVKGAVIGAAVGGILGGVIGNNVDVKKKKP